MQNEKSNYVNKLIKIPLALAMAVALALALGALILAPIALYFFNQIYQDRSSTMLTLISYEIEKDILDVSAYDYFVIAYPSAEVNFKGKDGKWRTSPGAEKILSRVTSRTPIVLKEKCLTWMLGEICDTYYIDDKYYEKYHKKLELIGRFPCAYAAMIATQNQNSEEIQLEMKAIKSQLGCPNIGQTKIRPASQIEK